MGAELHTNRMPAPQVMIAWLCKYAHIYLHAHTQLCACPSSLMYFIKVSEEEPCDEVIFIPTT